MLDAVLCAMSAAIYMQWCLPWLPTERISRMVLLNTAFPPHPLFTELGLSNALLVTIWQAAVTLLLRNVQVGCASAAGMYFFQTWDSWLNTIWLEAAKGIWLQSALGCSVAD